jgi:very-short-patch-repair endonuclease
MLQSANPHNYNELRKRARALRTQQTPAEKVLWNYLRQRPCGVKFLRQHIIANYIVDFFAYEKALIIEVDGDYHNNPEQQAADKARQDFLERNGYTVLRFTNDQVVHHAPQIYLQIKESLSN